MTRKSDEHRTVRHYVRKMVLYSLQLWIQSGTWTKLYGDRL